jgi:hypothetical protein
MDMHSQIQGSVREKMLNHAEGYPFFPDGYKKGANVPVDAAKIMVE